MWKTWLRAVKIHGKGEEGVQHKTKEFRRTSKTVENSDLKSDKEWTSSLKKVIKKAAAFYKYTRINFLFVGERHWILGDQTLPFLAFKAWKNLQIKC